MISLPEALQEVDARHASFPFATALRDPEKGEPCHLHFDHAAKTFSFTSLDTGESIRLPDIVEVVMNLRGMTRV